MTTMQVQTIMQTNKVLQMPLFAPLADAAARDLALDVGRSWVVEAPAGSGKTELLIKRYLRLLAHRSVTQPEQVLAITFTRAATEEIRQRVLRELQRADEAVTIGSGSDRLARSLSEAVLERDRRLGWRLLDDPLRLRVRTIDAVCAEIARSAPILSGGGATLSPVEDASPLYAEAARRTWLHLGGEQAALSKALRIVLSHRDGDVKRCQELLATMLMEREQWSSLVPLREEDLADDELESKVRTTLDQTLERVICEALSRLIRSFPERSLDRLTSLANALADRPGYRDQISPIAICRELRCAPVAATDHLEHWRALAHLLVTPSSGSWRNSFRKNHLYFETSTLDQELLREVLLEVRTQPALLDLLNSLSTLPPVRFPDDQWIVTKALLRILRQGLTELQMVFAERGACDFAEPGLLARYALDSKGGARSFGSATGIELKHLLVDEMQDTSTRQYELLERLTSGWGGEAKTVFLVGDPKQSVYLFRQAQVERFLGTMRREMLGDLPVGLLRLTANFRSQPALVQDVNQDFAAIFPPSNGAQEEVSFTRAVPARASAATITREASRRWHLAGAERALGSGKDASRLQAMNARAIRALIDSWRARPLPSGRTTPWTIAVLVRSRVSLSRVLAELRRGMPVPFRAVKIDTLNERREVLDLLALTRALLHPADRTAWLAVLRAPWCGLDLADLHRIVGQDDPKTLGQTVMELISIYGPELSLEGAERLGRVWPVLNAATHLAGRLRVPELVERTWRSLGGDAYLEGTERDNAQAYLELLRSLDQEAGDVTLTELERRLTKLFASSAAEEGAVDLLTIHGAKGLEWDVVLVPELERGTPITTQRLLDWEELPQGGVVLAPISGKGEESQALTRWLRSVRAAREAAETKRLLYVASTRAREELHLFGVPVVAASGMTRAPSGSLLEAAWPAAELYLPSAAQPPADHKGVGLSLAAANDTISQEQSTLLWRLPLSVLPAQKLALLPLAAGAAGPPSETSDRFSRPERSFASRAFGNAVHAFLEELATSLSGGRDPLELLAEIPGWEPRVGALLRASGLSAGTVRTQTRATLTALRRSLESKIGQWLLGARRNARNEMAVAVWRAGLEQYRIDRIFHAGAEPGAAGEQHLWIIDYKTATDPAAEQSDAALAVFLAHERERYRSQLERYAKVIGQPDCRLGLWFPLLGRLTWWVAGEAVMPLHGNEVTRRS